MDNSAESITAAVAALRTRAGMSMADFAKALKYKGASSYQRYENPSEYKGGYLKRDLVAKMARALIGKGEPPIRQQEVWILAGPEFQPRFVDTFDPDDAEIEASELMTHGTETGAMGIPIDASPQVDVTAGLGAGGVTTIADGVPGLAGLTFSADVVKDYWRLPDELRTVLGVARNPHSLAILPVEGTSMLPVLMEGDYVFVDTRRRLPTPDGIFALADEYDSIVVKILRSSDAMPGEQEGPWIEVVSANGDFPVKRRRAEDVRIIGRVVRRVTADFGLDR